MYYDIIEDEGKLMPEVNKNSQEHAKLPAEQWSMYRVLSSEKHGEFLRTPKTTLSPSQQSVEHSGFLSVITADSISELKKKTRSNKFLVLKHPSPEIFRHAIEKSLIDAVLPDRSKGKDYLHHKGTLLNNVNAKIMNKNKISIIFTLDELRQAHGITRALIWGRMQYDAFICEKKKVPVILATWKGKSMIHSLIALGELIGLSPESTRKALKEPQEAILKRICNSSHDNNH